MVNEINKNLAKALACEYPGEDEIDYRALLIKLIARVSPEDALRVLPPASFPREFTAEELYLVAAIEDVLMEPAAPKADYPAELAVIGPTIR